MSAAIEIGVRSRWDALALLKELDPYRPYLVQLEHEQWLVRIEAPGRHGTRLSRSLMAVDESLAVRRIDDAVVRVDGRVRPPGKSQRSVLQPPRVRRQPVEAGASR